MIAILFLIVSFLFGWSVISRMLPQNLQKDTIKIPLSMLLGIFFSVWLTFLINLFFTFLISITIAQYVLLFSCFFIHPFRKKKFHILLPQFSLIELALLGILVLITIFLVHQSLHFTSGSTLQIGVNEWGDFDIHLPLIRSFAWGINMPPALPFFPNANSAYHFMFDYWCAILEFGGMPLTYAFNVASIISFSSLLFCLYFFSKSLFSQKKIIGILTIILFFFNSSLEFIEAYQKLHLKNFFQFFPDIIRNNHYFSAGPYTSDIVSIIWNMNVYLNQRHLLFGFAIGIAILIFLHELLQKNLQENYALGIGILIGLTPFWSIHAFICLLIVTAILLLFHMRKSNMLFASIPIAVLVALPQTVWLSHDVRSFIQINPGFLAPRPLAIQGIFIYWFYNLGLSLLTIPLGFLLANREQKRWFLGFFAIFLIANIFQFNNDMVNNHKLFNFWLILSNMFTAYIVYKLISQKIWWGWAVVFLLLFFLTFSGIIDMFVVKNENFYTISDYPVDTTIVWVASNTPQNAIILLPADSIYNPVRLAGRKTFAPSPRYADAYGYNVIARNNLIHQIYSSTSIGTTNTLLKQNHINYVELPKNITATFSVNYALFKGNFPVVFSNSEFDLVAVP